MSPFFEVITSQSVLAFNSSHAVCQWASQCFYACSQNWIRPDHDPAEIYLFPCQEPIVNPKDRPVKSYNVFLCHKICTGKFLLRNWPAWRPKILFSLIVGNCRSVLCAEPQGLVEKRTFRFVRDYSLFFRISLSRLDPFIGCLSHSCPLLIRPFSKTCGFVSKIQGFRRSRSHFPKFSL
jgi:hypothetical protein